MVLSYSGKSPHMVTPVKGGGFSCDSNCANWKSLGVCSHSIAGAEVNGKLSQFIAFVQKKKKRPNITCLGTTSMPRGRGCPRKRKARTPCTSRVSMCTPGDGNTEQMMTSTSSSSSPQASTAGISSPVLQSSLRVNVSGMSSVATPSGSGWQAYNDPSTYTPYPSCPSWMWPPPSYSPWTWPNSLPPPTPPTSLPSMSSYPLSAQSQGHDTYKICFKVGNNNIHLHGCQNTFSAADKIVVQHAEFRQFTSPRTGLPSSKYGNTYYHPSRKCIELKWGGNFSTSHVISPDNVRSQLTLSQKDTLFQEFGVPQQ